jgi:hypothetical protein
MLQPIQPGYYGASNYYKPGVTTIDQRQELYEYLLVANPDHIVGRLVIAEKQSVQEKYQQQSALQNHGQMGDKVGLPHITVAKYMAKEGMEETIERWVQRICNLQKSFKVILNNFGGYPPHTLYIRVQNPQPFHSLVSQLKVIDSYVTGNSGHPVQFASKPHLPLAKKLPDDLYNKALFDYASRDFHESFVVNELVLLKRKNNGDAFQTVGIFRLLPEVDDTVYTTQLNAF